MSRHLLHRVHEGRKVRLVQGDTASGCSWLNAHDVVGRIGRSTGRLNVPLLIEAGADGGGQRQSGKDWRRY